MIQALLVVAELHWPAFQYELCNPVDVYCTEDQVPTDRGPQGFWLQIVVRQKQEGAEDSQNAQPQNVSYRIRDEVNYVSNTDQYIKPQLFFALSKFLRNIRSDPFLRYRTVPAKVRMSSIRRSGCSMAPKWPPRGISVQ